MSNPVKLAIVVAMTCGFGLLVVGAFMLHPAIGCMAIGYLLLLAGKATHDVLTAPRRSGLERASQETDAAMENLNRMIRRGVGRRV